MPRTRRIASLLVVLALFPICLPACRHTPDEEQVRGAVAAMAKAAAAGSAGDLVAPLSEDFDGNAGALDRRRLASMVRLLTLRGGHVGVTMGPVAVERRGERLMATFTVTLSSGGRLLPDRLGLYRVESAWRKEGGDWRCYTASWKRTI